MSTPAVPPRPARSQEKSTTSTNMNDGPVVPPRPSRHFERSQSPGNREAYTRSPLNDSPFASKKPSVGNLNQNDFYNGGERLGRAPSVSSLPLVGQEGMEYASFDDAFSAQDAVKNVSAPAQTRNIAGDLPLHAPKASVSAATARNQIATVTRTDSTHAAMVGVGKPSTEVDEPETPLRLVSSSKPSPRRVSQTYSPDMFRSKSRPESFQEHEQEHGIPQFGLQVPMYPNAGDVQAPSPAPFSPQPTGIGFFNDASRQGHGHGRKKSVQGFHGPPGSYGLHGHGVSTQDQFEKAWYSKHPDQMIKEQEGAYGPGMAQSRGQWALSSEELNKIVRETKSRNENLGTTSGMIGTPTEAVGYMATEEYTSRMSSPRVPPLHLSKTRSRTASQNHMESPLRKASFPAELHDSEAVESELEDDAIHLDPPERRASKFGGAGYDPPTEDLGPRGGNTEEMGGFINERGDGTPILASDETAKYPGAEYLQPAISPEQEKRGDDTYFSGAEGSEAPYQTDYRTRSRSRPRSTHEKSGLSRFVSHGEYDSHQAVGTPLEDVEEYEPLFNDEEEIAQKKPFTAADRLKRPELETHRFPSQDIWEDTPSSLQYTTEVSGPQEPEDLTSPVMKRAAAALFESPEKEAARKGEVLESERLSFLQNPDTGFAKPKFNAGVQQDMLRPGMRQRFPSQDIWEDTPDSLRLETTIDPADSSATTSPKVISPTSGQKYTALNSVAKGFEAADPALTAPLQKPAVPARPTRSHAAESEQAAPSIPPRPSQRQQEDMPSEAQPSLSQTNHTTPAERKAPGLPERPKPQVPARPNRAAHEEVAAPVLTSVAGAEESSSLEKATSPPTKPKPSVPLRPPTSSKFASLKAGFMNDLNSRLQLGPQAPPKPQPPPESEEDAAPLVDARKSRARGPARRKPAESSASATPTTTRKVTFSIAQPLHTWSIDPSTPDKIKIGRQTRAPSLKTASQFAEQPSASPLARNTAGEALQSPSEAPATTSGALAHEANEEMDARASREEVQRKEKIRPFVEQTIGHSGDVPEPAVDESIKSAGFGNERKQVDSTVMGAEGVAVPSQDEETLESKDDAESVSEPLLGSIVGKATQRSLIRMAKTEVAPETATEIAEKTEGETMPGEFPNA